MNINETYTFAFPTTIHFGVGVSRDVPLHLKDMSFKRPLIVTDPQLEKLPLFGQFLDNFRSQKMGVQVFSKLSKNPVKSNVTDGVNAFLENEHDSVVAIGGGVAMDVARAICLGAYHTKDLFYYDDAKGGDQFITEKIPYFITVPTTSGTGSEVGRSAIIADDDTHIKKILYSPRLLAKKVFADPALTVDLPDFITASTGIDALTHNVEAYLAKPYHPICDGIALEGIRLIGSSLVKAFREGNNLQARAEMMLGSTMGAIAFQKGLGLVHSMAHALSTVFDTHHGLANAIMIVPGMKFNSEVSEDRMVRICEVLNLSKKSSASFIEYLSELLKNLNLPTSIKSQGATKDHLESLSQVAFSDVCHSLNPRPVTQEDFKNIFQESLCQ